MIVLGFDTSAAHVAAALLQNGEIIAQQREAMKRGQAERLMMMLEGLLENQSLEFADLNAIGVGVGPGNFTGIRVAVSAARGLALGLKIPAIGVNRFDVIRAAFGSDGLPSVRAPQDNIYVQENTDAPRLISIEEAQALEKTPQFEPDDFNPAPFITQIAAARAGSETHRPAPLYIKSADAAPARDAPPTIIR